MREIGLAFVVLLVGVTAGMLALLGRARARRLTRERLAQPMRDDEFETDAGQPPVGSVRVFARRHYLLPWILAFAVGLGLRWGLIWPWPFVAAISAMVGLLGQQLDAAWLATRTDRIENQLADAIDLMVAAVKAGASLEGALTSAIDDSPNPLRSQLEEVLARMRLGDDLVAILIALTRRVPLETYRLFATTLIVNWEVGGPLAATLAQIGRTIRDRIELSRRMRSLTAQARVSVVSVLAVTYFIAALMWRSDPERMLPFLRSSVGQGVAATAMFLQGVGIVWITVLSKPRF